MPKFVKPLTETQLRNIKPKATPYSDGNNLYLFVRPAIRSFVYIYTHPTTKKRIKRKIGEHPHDSLAQIREQVRGYNQLLAKGVDPFEYTEQQAKEQAKLGITLFEFAHQWRRLKLANQENKPSTMTREWRRLETHPMLFSGTVRRKHRRRTKRMILTTPHNAGLFLPEDLEIKFYRMTKNNEDMRTKK